MFFVSLLLQVLQIYLFLSKLLTWVFTSWMTSELCFLITKLTTLDLYKHLLHTTQMNVGPCFINCWRFFTHFSAFKTCDGFTIYTGALYFRLRPCCLRNWVNALYIKFGLSIIILTNWISYCKIVIGGEKEVEIINLERSDILWNRNNTEWPSGTYLPYASRLWESNR